MDQQWESIIPPCCSRILLRMGWGVHLPELTASDVWTEDEAYLHINDLEIITVLLSLHAFQELMVYHTVVIMNDNAITVAYVNK